MTQPPSRAAQAWTFVRRNWLVWLTAILGLIAVILPILVVYIEIQEERPTTLLGWAKQGAILTGTIVALLLFITSRKNEINHLSGLRIGRDKTIKSWELSAYSLVGAQRLMNQAMSQSQSKRPDEAKQAIREVMLCVRKTVVGVFADIPEDDLTITLGIPLASGVEMKVFELMPQRARRMPGGVYMFPANDADLHSMLEAFKKGEVIYTPNANGVTGMESKEYRSILSFPVVDRHRHPIAVLNVDSAHPALFDIGGKAEPDNVSIVLVNELIQPALQLIAGALEHCDPYRMGASS